MLHSLLMAFSLYSRIPVPQTVWNGKGMRYCICFLPLVGAVIGAGQGAVYILLARIGAGPILRGTVLTALPLLLSGGIHMDGFMDTCDAIHSYGTREKRLQILKDPHVGAFAVIGALVYLLVDFGIWSEAAGFAAERGALCLCILCPTFVLSRALSAFAAVTFPKAKKDGMLRQETDPAARGTGPAMAVTAAATTALMIFLPLLMTFRPQEAAGPKIQGMQGMPNGLLVCLPGLCAAAAGWAVLICYRRMALRHFGGTTGDLAGWFTQTCELVTALAAVIVLEIL